MARGKKKIARINRGANFNIFYIFEFYDRSNSQTTQLFGDDAFPFEMGRIRRVVVSRRINRFFRMGGLSCDLVRFRLVWQPVPLQMSEKDFHDRVEPPRLARTIDEAPTVLPSGRITRIHTPGDARLKLRVDLGDELGSGQFGLVRKALDVDSGRALAVKMIKQSTGGVDWSLLKREVETLARISHVGTQQRPFIPCLISSRFIVEYVGNASTDVYFNIYMALKEGNLDALISRDYFQQDPPRMRPVLHQMLQALDYLAYNGIIHRDVKPANILYSALPEDKHQYYLADFGLCNHIRDARTQVGSPIFMAPEILQGTQQTAKVDVWSLFVTIAWALDEDHYRNKSLFTNDQKLAAAAMAAASPRLQEIREMAMQDPNQRPSAAQVLLRVFGGEGLTTPRAQAAPPARLDLPINRAQPEEEPATHHRPKSGPGLGGAPPSGIKMSAPRSRNRKFARPLAPAAPFANPGGIRKPGSQQLLPESLKPRQRAPGQFPD